MNEQESFDGFMSHEKNQIIFQMRKSTTKQRGKKSWKSVHCALHNRFDSVGVSMFVLNLCDFDFGFIDSKVEQRYYASDRTKYKEIQSDIRNRLRKLNEKMSYVFVCVCVCVGFYKFEYVRIHTYDKLVDVSECESLIRSLFAFGLSHANRIDLLISFLLSFHIEES